LVAIIFGSSGQDGIYLTQKLKENKIQVIGVSRSGFNSIKGDIGDLTFVEKIIIRYKPNFIFHLAAISTTQHSHVFENNNAISIGTLNLLESVKRLSPSSKVFLSGSAMQFKNHGLPINENSDFDPSSIYSVARIHSVYTGRYYRDKFNLKIYVGYFFNHDSYYRSEQHVNKKISAAVQRIRNGSKEKIHLGSLDVYKEFNFAGDIIDAVWLLVNQDNIFEVVIGSGKSYSIGMWLEKCFEKINLDWKDYVILNSKFVPEYKNLVSNPSLIKSLGWNQRIEFDQLVDLMVGD